MPGALERADELLLLRIDRDCRFAGGDRRTHALVDQANLRIAIEMLRARQRLTI